VTALLEVRELTLGYGKVEAVSALNLDVQAGQVVCLIGANGAGKTTTLRGLSGLIRPRAGSILFDGRDLAGLPAYAVARRGVVQAPEGRQIFGEMTVDENLSMGAYLARDRKLVEARREDVLSRFPRLRERLSQRAGLLSGGEQQMLAIGRALMADPKLLLLDEPSMGLAPLFVEEIFRIVETLKGEGRTILLVEQNARAALDVADHAYVIESGRIAIHGPAKEVADMPEVANAYLGG
jgi:branched-chain amino acid transport system ATP-binding protein